MTIILQSTEYSKKACACLLLIFSCSIFIFIHHKDARMRTKELRNNLATVGVGADHCSTHQAHAEHQLLSTLNLSPRLAYYCVNEHLTLLLFQKGLPGCFAFLPNGPWTCERRYGVDQVGVVLCQENVKIAARNVNLPEEEVSAGGLERCSHSPVPV